MEYFLLKQDERYNNTPILRNVFNTIDNRNINRLNAHKIDDVVVFQIIADENSKFLDVLDSQLFLVSEKMKKILEKYDADIIFKILPLIDSAHDRQENYYLPIFEEVEALSSNAEFNLDKSIVKKIILDRERIKGKKIFKIKECFKPLIVVRLDAAESLLRRRFKGISLVRLETE